MVEIWSSLMQKFFYNGIVKGKKPPLQSLYYDQGLITANLLWWRSTVLQIMLMRKTNQYDFLRPCMSE